MRPPRWLLLLLLLLPAFSAHSQGFGTFGEVPLTDLLEVVVLEGELLAIDANGGGQLSQQLHLSEEVVWTGAQGRIGLVIFALALAVEGAGSAPPLLHHAGRYRGLSAG